MQPAREASGQDPIALAVEALEALTLAQGAAIGTGNWDRLNALLDERAEVMGQLGNALAAAAQETREWWHDRLVALEAQDRINREALANLREELLQDLDSSHHALKALTGYQRAMGADGTGAAFIDQAT